MRKTVQFSSSCAEDLQNMVNWIVDGAEWAWCEIKKTSMLAYFVLLLAMVSRG